jgi:hypothetical protein
LLKEIEEHGLENDARVTERPRKMLNLEPASAQLLSILVRASGVSRAIEIGTSNAYSTIWLAWSLAPAGGRILSIDRNPDKHVLARENLRRANLLDRVEATPLKFRASLTGRSIWCFWTPIAAVFPSSFKSCCPSSPQKRSSSPITFFPIPKKSPST